MEMINEVMDKKVLGLAGSRLPESPAKSQLARIVAARAVITALTPGMPPLQRMTILPRGESIARTLFLPQVSFTNFLKIWHFGRQEGYVCNFESFKFSGFLLL